VLLSGFEEEKILTKVYKTYDNSLKSKEGLDYTDMPSSVTTDPNFQITPVGDKDNNPLFSMLLL
jgi:hypothetical protein